MKMNDKFILGILIFGLGYYQYRDLIYEQINKPYFYVFGICLLGLLVFLYFFLGYHFEKLLNRLRMWTQGVRLDSEAQTISYPFHEFNLQESLDKFYKEKDNLDYTFIGLNAEKSNKEIIRIPDEQRSQHLQV